MAAPNGHTPPARNPAPPASETRGAQLITEADYLRLYRISDAVDLLGRLPSDAAKLLGIKADHTSAVAHYIAEDLAAILSRVRPADE